MTPEEELNSTIENLLSAGKRFGLTAEAYTKYMNKSIGVEKASVASKKSQTNSMDKLSHTVQKLDRSYQDMTRSAEGFMSGLRYSANGFISILGLVGEKALQLGRQWQGMTNMGHTFGGSMVKMVGAAADAGLSLEDFTEAYRKHNLVIGATNGRLFDFAKGIRQNTAVAGNYGMTVEQMTDFTADSLEISRKNGTLQSALSQQGSRDMMDLMASTTALAASSDKARDEISKLANEALSSNLAFAAFKTAPPELKDTMEKSAKEIATGFASLPGEAGSFFSKFYSNSLAGMANLTDQAKPLITMGLGGLVNQMGALARKPNASLKDEFDYQNKFIDTVDAQMTMLKQQAASNGPNSDAANTVLELRKNMQKQNYDEFLLHKKEVKNTEEMTAMMASFASNLQLLNSSFMSGLVNSLTDMLKNMTGFNNGHVMQDLQDLFKRLGTVLGTHIGTWIKSFGGPAGIEKSFSSFIDGLTIFAKLATSIANGLLTIVDIMTFVTTPFKGFGDVLSNLIKGLTVLGGSVWALSRMLTLAGLAKTVLVGGKASVVPEVLAGGGILGVVKKLMGRGGAGAAEEATAVGEEAAVSGGLLGALRGSAGSVGGLLKGTGGGLLKGVGGTLGLSALLESIGYFSGDKSFTLKNLAKSGLSVGGSVLGGVLGSFAGPVGTGAGGIAGYSAGGWLGNKLLGPDDVPKSDADAVAAAGAPGTSDPTLDQMNSAIPDTTSKENHDNIARMVDQMTEQTTVLHTLLSTINTRLNDTNRLLTNTYRTLS